LLRFTEDVDGSGSYTGNILFSDGFSPGNSIAAVSLENVAFDSSASLLIELESASSYDSLLVTGDATLAGTLDVTVLSPFTLVPGQVFEIIDVAGALSGTFDGLAEGELVGNFSGTNLLITYAGGDGNDVTLLAALPGDFDFDLDVDGLDFLKWQRGQSPTPNSASDLADWETNYGVGPLSAVATTVPEPSTGLTLMLAATIFCHHRARLLLRTHVK
jgi:hypothetical protein